MSKIYKDHQHTVPIGINARQIAKEKKNQTQKSEPTPANFSLTCVYIYSGRWIYSTSTLQFYSSNDCALYDTIQNI